MKLNSKKINIGEKIQELKHDEKGRIIIDPALFMEDIYELMCSRHFCDGLPILPPTKTRVEKMLKYSDRELGEIIAFIPPRNMPATTEKLAINAVMAGCKPEYFPIIITAFEAISEQRYNLGAVATTTYPTCNAFIISGPIAKEVGINSDEGCLGPGFRANATIGRAINLAINNIGGVFVGVNYHPAHQSPAKYTYAFGENIDENPWASTNVEAGYTSDATTVTAFGGEGPINIGCHSQKTSEDILFQISKAACVFGSNPVYCPCSLLIILSPMLANMIANEGWSKEEVKLFIFENARHKYKKTFFTQLRTLAASHILRLTPDI